MGGRLQFLHGMVLMKMKKYEITLEELTEFMTIIEFITFEKPNRHTIAYGKFGTLLHNYGYSPKLLVTSAIFSENELKGFIEPGAEYILLMDVYSELIVNTVKTRVMECGGIFKRHYTMFEESEKQR